MTDAEIAEEIAEEKAGGVLERNLMFPPRWVISQPQAAPLPLWNNFPGDTLGLDEQWVAKQLPKMVRRLKHLLKQVRAADRFSVLLAMQGLDASGKCTTIAHLFPQLKKGKLPISYFRAPTPKEARHDFLWRVHPATPARGRLAIWHRTHYEDVLYPRVHEQITLPQTWARYRQIAAFEQELAHNVADDTLLFKVFFHISQEEQARRLAERVKLGTISPGDISEQPLYREYMAAYADLLAVTGRPWAPWLIVPADKSWVSDYLIASHLIGRLLAKLAETQDVAPPGQATPPIVEVSA